MGWNDPIANLGGVGFWLEFAHNAADQLALIPDAVAKTKALIHPPECEGDTLIDRIQGGCFGLVEKVIEYAELMPVVVDEAKQRMGVIRLGMSEEDVLGNPAREKGSWSGHDRLRK
jgi:hypothetical protein